MKTKIVVVILLMIMSFKVSALSYTDYSDFGEYSENYIASSDLVDVKKERRYKYYKNERINGEYALEPSLEFPLIDYNTYTYTDYSLLSPEVPEMKEGREIVSGKGYVYRKLKNVNNIIIERVSNNIKINEFQLIYKGKELKYEIDKDKSDGEIGDDGGFNDIYINLPFEIDLADLDIVFKASGDASFQSIFRLMFGYDNNLYTCNLYFFTGDFDLNWDSGKASVINYADDMYDFYSFEKRELTNILGYKTELMLYQYRDKVYQTYKENKIYYDDYLNQPYLDYIYKDEDDFKDFYAYRVRNIIPENISVDNLKDSENESGNDVLYTFVSDDSIKFKPNVTSDVIDSMAETDNLEILPSDFSSHKSLKTVIKKDDDVSWYYEVFIFGIFFILLILVLSKQLKRKS